MTTSFKLFFPENWHFAQKLYKVYKDNPQVSIVQWLFKICLSHISLLDYLVEGPIFFTNDSRYFQFHDTLCLFEVYKIENFVLEYKDFCLLKINFSWGALTDHCWFYTFKWLKLGDFVYGSRQNHLFLIFH